MSGTEKRASPDRPSLPRRFYGKAAVGPQDEAYTILLDGRPVRTPARRSLLLPGRAAAQLIADEFEAQREVIDPESMPVCRLANTAIDGVADDPQAVAEDIVKFAGSDLLCYRAELPPELVAIQSAKWDPTLEWYRDEFGANFVLGQGIVPVTQPKEAIAVFGALLRRYETPLALASLHTITTLTGSALLAIALADRFVSPVDAWEAAHVDEDWNIAQWGEDAEATARRERRWLEMQAAARLLASLQEK